MAFKAAKTEAEKWEFVEEVEPVFKPGKGTRGILKYRRYKVIKPGIGEVIVWRSDYMSANGLSKPRTKPIDVGDLGGKLWGALKSKAKYRNKPFEITQEEAWAIYEEQGGLCKYSGEPITLTTCATPNDGGGSHPDYKKISASGDRIDSSKGYFRWNFQWVSAMVNFAKRDLTEKQFLNMCMKIVVHSFDYMVQNFPDLVKKLEKKMQERADAGY